MFKIICVTNRKLCKNDFLVQIENVAKAKVSAIVLREKDLSEDEYFSLAVKVKEICDRYGVLFVAHNFIDCAKKIGCTAIHLPFSKLGQISENDRAFFKILGASCHSAEDSVFAEKSGCTYIFAGNVFETDCKKGLKGKGVDFVREVSKSVNIPVFAIGGISKENVGIVEKNGADGCCSMSGFMTAENVKKYTVDLKGGGFN